MWPSVRVAFVLRCRFCFILLSNLSALPPRFLPAGSRLLPEAMIHLLLGPACSAFPPKRTHYPVSARFHSNVLVEKRSVLSHFSDADLYELPLLSVFSLSPRQTLGQSWNRNKLVMFFLWFLPWHRHLPGNNLVFLGCTLKPFFPNFIWHLYVLLLTPLFLFDPIFKCPLSVLY